MLTGKTPHSAEFFFSLINQAVKILACLYKSTGRCCCHPDVGVVLCVYSNSHNDVPRVAQWYGTIATHTRRRASVLVVLVVFCMHRMPPPTFSDTAITNPHSDTTIFQLRAHWVRISWSIGSEKSFGHVPPVGVEPSTSCMQGEHLIH